MKLRLLAVAALAAASYAQMNPPAGAPQQQAARFDALKAYLGIDDAAIQALVTARRAEMESLRSDAQQIAEKRRSLRQQLDSASPNAAAVGQLMLDIRNAEKGLAEKRRALSTAAAGSLTPDQKAKLGALAEAQKLRAAIREAVALGLLAAPERGDGLMGPGMGRWFAPGEGRMMRGRGHEFRQAPRVPRGGRL